MVIIPDNAVLSPLIIDENVSSLSAILLDDAYYNFLKNGIVLIENIPVLDAAYIIPFKVKAWMDLTEKKASGIQVDSRDIKKHKNDIYTLMGLLTQDTRIDLPDTIRSDMQFYLNTIGEDRIESTRMKTAYKLL